MLTHTCSCAAGHCARRWRRRGVASSCWSKSLERIQMSTDTPVLAWRRPLCAAVAAAGRGRFVLDGVARMRERPIADLVDGLRQLGVDAECTAGTGCPPVTVIAAGLPSGTVRRRQLCVPCVWICCRHRLPTGDRQRRRPTLRHGETAVSSWAAAQLAQHVFLTCRLAAGSGCAGHLADN